MGGNSEDRRSIFDRPVHDQFDRMFDKDHDGWMTPSERAHRQSYLTSLSEGDDSSDDWDDEDDDEWDDDEDMEEF